MPTVAAAARAQAASGNTAIPGANPATGTIRVMGVWYRPVSNVTGANTDTRLLRLRNTTTTTDHASLQLNAGVNLIGGRWNRIPLAAAPPVVAAVATQTLQWESNAVGLGLADPGGDVRVRWERVQSVGQRTVTDPQGRSIITDPELAMDVDAPPEPTDYP